MRQQAVGNRCSRVVRTHALIVSILGIMVALCIALARVAIAAPVADPFADQVISYNPGPDWTNDLTPNPYADPSNALHAPMDKFAAEEPGDLYVPNNSSIVTLGNGGNMVLKFNTPIENDPRNPYGLDFTVFGNAQVYEVLNWDTWEFEFMRWQELAFVEISQNGSNWYLIKPSILPANLRACHSNDTDPDAHNYDVGESYTAVSGYAEYTPTMGLPQYLDYPFTSVSRTPEELYTVPDRTSKIRDLGYTNPVGFDFVSGGGDAFDIADAVVETAPGVPLLVNGQTVPAGINSFSYVRITDAHPDDYWGILKQVAADIDGVSRTRPALSIGETKALGEGDYALITEAIVTAVFPNEFFIESPNRSAAMGVKWNSGFRVNDERAVAIGDKVTITGHLSKANSKFSFNDPMLAFTSINSPLPKPLGVPIQNLDLSLIYGMRVRTWGKITDAGDGYEFVIAESGKDIKISSETYCNPRATGTYVAVTGICDREEGTGNTILRVVNPQDDIRSYQ